MTPPSTTHHGRLWPFLLAYAAVAIWIAFSGIHRVHNADTLMFSLASLYAWTPYFWEQDRVGMLVPLIASVFSDPIQNLVVQTGLTVFAGLCVPLLAAELAYPHPINRIAATFANAAMLLLAPDRIRENLLVECYYPLSMALGCGGLLLLGRGVGWPRWWRVVGAAALLILSCWVYIGVPLWLGPLAVVRGWLQSGDPPPSTFWERLFRPVLHARTFLGLALLVVAFGLGLVWMKAARMANPELIGATPQNALPPTEWLASWHGFFEHLARLPGMLAWVLALAVPAGMGVLARITMRKPGVGEAGSPLLTAIPILLVPAAAEFLFIGTREWTAMNDHHPRYLLGSIESVQVLLALFAVAPLARLGAGARGWILGAFSLLLLLAAATAQYGFPAPHRPRAELDALAGAWTPELILCEVDSLGGDYWTVWPAVYHVNLERRELGDGRIFCGIVLRGRVLLLAHGYNEWKEWKVAVRRDAKELADFQDAARICGFATPVKIGECGAFDIYLTHPVAMGRE